MATTTWGQNNLNGISISADAGDQFDPAVADSAGGSFGVAWASAAGIEVRFFDVIGEPDPALGGFTLNSGALGASYGQTSMSAGGAGIGYGVTWQETAADGTTAINLRYIGLSAPVGGVVNVSSGNAGLVVHDVAMSGYTAVDATFRPISTVDGLNVAWIQTDTSVTSPLTAAQIQAGYGEVMLQRYAVPLDAKKDPAGPPLATGLDGAVGGVSDAPVSIAAIGRDVVVASDAHLSGDSIVAWVDAADVVHANFYTANGTAITTASGAILGGINLANLGTTTEIGKVQVVSDGGEFIVAWATSTGISGRVFVAGATPNTFAASNVIQLFNAANLPAGSTFTGEFSLGALIDTGGFAITVGATDGTGNKDLYSQSFNAGGGGDGIVTLVNGITVGDQDQTSAAALAGDRIVTVFRDTSAGDSNISAHILDARNPGLIIIGTDTLTRTVPDVLVGTVGDDTIRGLGDNDLLYGALGDDLIVGGAGNDIIDGGANGAVVGDVAVFSGAQTDYTVTHLGGALFTVTDNRAGSPDGTDTVKGVEFFRFGGVAGVDVLASSFIPTGPGVTPAAWGMTDADADLAPNPAGTPDVDGFIVNSAPGVRVGAQTHPFVADSVGEFVGVAWETPGADGNTHIRGQFYDVVLAPDAFIPNAIDISDGVGVETNPVLTSGGANSGWGAVWEQRDNASDATREIRTNFVGPGTLTGPELTVLAEGANVDQHDAALSGSFLDRTLQSPVGGSVLPTGMNEGYNVAWVSTDTGGGGDPNYGRIMLQRYEVPLDPLGNPGAPARGGVDGIAGLGSDAAVQLAVSGRNPSTTAVHGFETGVIWIEQDGAGGERVAGRVYDDLGQVVTIPGFNNISAGFPVAAGTSAHIVSAGAVNFGVAWVTGTAAAGYQIVGTMYAPTGAGLNGEGFGFAAPAPFVLQNLPFGIDVSTLDFNLSGLSGENSEDLVVTWKQTSAGDGADVMARHIAVALDPVTGQVLSMIPEGNAITVNAGTEGDQDQNSIAGLLGDRFISVYHDTNNTYTDGDDIAARVIDTRAPGQNIEGDFLRLGLPQARRDVLVGTVGDDTIRGDIQDFDGRTDDIWGAMGNDVIMGGPGLRGAAGIPEQIFGGEGYDISVYMGRMQDYSVTVNGDGSYEIIDLRPTADAAGNPLMHDGVDNVFDVETLRFLNLPQVGGTVPANWASADPAFTDVALTAPGTPPPLPPGYNGTPVNWSLTDTTPFKEISIDAGAGVQSGMAVTNLQTGAALSWISGGGNQVWAVSHDTTGIANPIFLDVPTPLTDGGAGGLYSDNTVADIDVGMTAGLGLTAVWQSTDVSGNDSADISIHLRSASTNTHVVLGGGGVPGAGVTGNEAVVVGSDGAGVAVDPTVQGYEIVNTANGTLEFGFHAGYVLKTNAEDAYGDLMLARYEIPVYDILVNGAGLPILDGAGQGQLATDAAGNFIPSADLSKGSETAPISIGLDGLRGTADDSQSIVLTNAGLFSAADPLVGTDADHTPVKGRDLSIGTLHDGQLVVTYIDQSENVQLRIFVPHVDQNADRETGGLGGVDVKVTGLTTYSELAVPFPAMLGHVLNPGQTQYIVPQQNGSFGVFWADTGSAGTMAIKAIIYTGAGTNWIPSPVLTLQNNLDPATLFQISPTGVTPGGLEDGYFLSWESAGNILGQRYDMMGNPVGIGIMIDDPTNVAAENHTLHSAAGLDDGRILVGYQNAAGDVGASYLDTREPGVPIIGPRNGALRDVAVGTVGDDSMDGRALNDELYGGLGNDLITLGTGADIGDGGLGNDTIIGGSGQDVLIGGSGDDLLAGSGSGPADPQINRLLDDGLAAAFTEANTNESGLSNTGLTAAQISAFAANNPGADMISGGDGIDTITMQGEFGDFKINLATGVVESDRDLNGSFILEDVIGDVVDDGAGGQIFRLSANIENATGGIGDDWIIGNGGNNVIDAGGGNNTVDGAEGLSDRMVMHVNRTDLLISFDGATQTYSFVKPADGVSPQLTQTVRNVEFFTFNDIGTVTAAFLTPGPVATDDTATIVEDTAGTINVLANDANVDTAHVTAINGAAIVNGGAAIAVSHGSVLLTNAVTGTDHLIFTPSADYFGPAAFNYTVQNDAGQFSTANVNVTVTNVNDAPTDIIFTGGTSVNENAATGTVISTLSTTDPDNTAVATNDTFTYSLANEFGGAFQIVGNQIRVQNGTLLNFESGVTSYLLNVTSSDGHGGTFAESVTVNVNDVNEAPTDIIFNGNAATTAVSIAELPVSNAVATLSATDSDAAPNGAAGVTFGLADSADGRFSMTGNQISLVNPALIDFENPNLPSHSFTLQTTAKDAGAAVRTETLTVNVTNSAENVVAGATAGDNTLNGTAGNDIINGLAGKDTMTGLAGNDTYFVDNSGDKVTEGANAGNDTVYVQTLTSYGLGGNFENLIYLGAANGTSWRGNALDNAIVGGSGNDTLQGNDGNDHLIGNAGADSLQGGNGNDRLYGSAGNDSLTGGNGNDWLEGGAGNDTLIGGTNNDTYFFSSAFGADTIQSFGDVAGNQDVIAFSSNAVANFTALQSSMSQSGVNVQINLVGVGSITLSNVTLGNLGADDFLFI